MTPAEKRDALAALRALRVSGERRVRFGEREVEYRSDSEIAAAIKDLEGQITADANKRVRVVRFHARRGT